MSQARLLSLNWTQWGLIGIFLIGGGAVMTNIWKSNSQKNCKAMGNQLSQNAGNDTTNLANMEHTGNSPEFPANAQESREISAAKSNEIVSEPVSQAQTTLNPLTASQAKKAILPEKNIKIAPTAKVECVKPIDKSAINKREIAPATVAPVSKGADYHLIAASADSWKKAGVFKEDLKKQGFQAEIIHTPNTNVYRVSIFKNGDKKKVEEIKAKTKLAGTWIAQ